jgi:hypothetical protein
MQSYTLTQIAMQKVGDVGGAGRVVLPLASGVGARLLDLSVRDRAKGMLDSCLPLWGSPLVTVWWVQGV